MCSVGRCTFEGGITGIFVVISAFLIWVCTFGTSVSIGLYNEDFERDFNVSFASVSLIGAINLGIFHCIGPFVGLFTRSWGHRRVALGGAILSGVGLTAMTFSPNIWCMYFFFGVVNVKCFSKLLSREDVTDKTLVGAILSGVGLTAMTFSPNIWCMYFFFGVVNGCGNGFAVVSAQVLCGLHYNKYRGVTSSFVLSGNGGGATLFPIIIGNLIEKYGWRGSLFLLCGLNLHLFPMALALFPANCAFEEKEIGVKQEFVTSTDKAEGDDNANNVLQLDTNVALINRNDVEMNNTTKYKSHVMKIMKKEFLIFLLSIMTNQMGFGAVVIFLPQYVVSIGFSLSDASLSLSLLGGGFFLGCIGAGLLCKKLHLYVYTAGCIGFAIVIALLEVFQKRIVHMCLSTLSGCFAGFQFAPIFILTHEILSGKSTDIGFGFAMFAVGIGLTAGPPCAGSLMDVFGGTHYMIYFNFVVTLISGIVMMPFLIHQLINRCRTSA